jgi:molybdate-binding protein
VLGRVGSRLVAHRLAGSRVAPDAFVAADAHVGDRDLSVLSTEQQVSRTLLIAGCDPSLSILAAFVSRRSPEHRLVPLQSASETALRELSDGLVHVAGSHLPGGSGHDPNISHARRTLAGGGGLVVSYATWEQGIVVATGNPKRIRTVADLARGDLRIVNRDPGSGARRFLDDLLIVAGEDPSDVLGYETVVPTHMAVARSVHAGVADAGIALRAVASAFGLDFVPLADIRFDLVIPSEHLNHATVRVMLDVLQSREFRADLAALPGYEVSSTGTTLLELKAA